MKGKKWKQWWFTKQQLCKNATVKPLGLFSTSVKDMDTSIGDCQRPVFALGVSQHIHKITNL